MTMEQMTFTATPDGYDLTIHRQAHGWRVVTRTHDPLSVRWHVELELDGLSWSDAVEAAYTTLWGIRPGAEA